MCVRDDLFTRSTPRRRVYSDPERRSIRAIYDDIRLGLQNRAALPKIQLERSIFFFCCFFSRDRRREKHGGKERKIIIVRRELSSQRAQLAAFYSCDSTFLIRDGAERPADWITKLCTHLSHPEARVSDCRSII